MSEYRRPVVVDLQEPWIVCRVCGKDDVSRWGLAAYEDQIVPNDYEGEWGGQPCCERCYEAWQSGIIKPWMTFAEARRAVENPK